MPSLIAAGAQATETGFPLVARGDLYWPGVAGSSTNQQYIFLGDTLVAPIFAFDKNETSRTVWIPKLVYNVVKFVITRRYNESARET